MIAEAIDTIVTLGWALLAWIVLCALFATAALYTLVVTAAWIVCGLWRAARAVAALRTHQAPVSRPEPAPQGSRDTGTPPGASQTPSRPAPRWAHTDKDAA